MDCGTQVDHRVGIYDCFLLQARLKHVQKALHVISLQGRETFFSSSGELVNLVSTVSATAGGGMPPGSALHLPITASAAGGGVPPGSTLHLPVPAGAAGGGVPPGSALHLPVPAGAAGGGVPPGSALHLPVLAGAPGGGVPSFHLPISTGAFPSVSTSRLTSNILELPLYAPMDSSAHGKYY